MVYKDFKQTEAQRITCALKTGFALFLGPVIPGLLLLWAVGQVLDCAKEKIFQRDIQAQKIHLAYLKQSLSP